MYNFSKNDSEIMIVRKNTQLMSPKKEASLSPVKPETSEIELKVLRTLATRKLREELPEFM